MRRNDPLIPSRNEFDSISVSPASTCSATPGASKATRGVITGTLPGKRLSDLQPFWQRVRARAGVKDVRIHDLRHTFASTAVASGQDPLMIGKLIGHTQVQTTARYAHLAAEPVRMAADAVAQNLRQSLG
jgi:integrase